MAQIDSNLTKEQVAQMEREFARKRAAAERRRAAELARLSEERTSIDEHRTIWTYVVVDNSFIRIISCDTAEERLSVPPSLEGLPLKEVDPEAFSSLVATREIVFPDSIETIGAYAFRGCENLERLVLPARTTAFSSSWISRCPNLKELVLPESLETVTNEVLSNPAVETLRIGRNTRFVQPGAFEKTRLATVCIDSGNNHLRTDDICIYSADGSELIALAKPSQCYKVAEGCRRIAVKAFAGAKLLEHVKLPGSVARIDELAFANSGIKTFDCPTGLVEIAPRAFLRCLSLETVHLNDGLRIIGDEAFAGSALKALRVPASVERFGNSVTVRSSVCHAGIDATFSIDGNNRTYFIDEQGCLYRNDSDGVHLVQMLDPTITAYEVNCATTAIDGKAFAYHNSIESIKLPDGLKSIGNGAFRVCRKLQSVSIPDSLESLGTDAFIDTALGQFRIPEKLVDIGRNALVTDGAHHEGVPPALRSVDVDPRNPRFFMHTGMLCRRTDYGSNVVMFTCSCERVEFPADTIEVEDYALNNAFGIRELHLNARLRTIGVCGLSVMSQIRYVRIDVEKPIEGKTSFVLHFPATTHSVHGFLLALGGLGHLYLPDIMAQYDNCIASARDYRAPGKSENASAYEQVKLIIDRLNDSILLTDAGKKRYRMLVVDNIEEICADIARHDDRVAMGQLADLGLLTADNLDTVVVAVNKLQDAAMTGYLLEMKRLRFSAHAIDFDL
ncbi:MAG: leucine-rich repeat domain-containing protein [Eggerthellaceae bacterium]|nr:leucine-rich repeat domain-containing protein [Eggerthellaceae bacterium]